MNFTDKWLTCESCGQQFLWDAGEQAWYYVQRLRNAPRHCKSCRDQRKRRPPSTMNRMTSHTTGR